MSIRSLIFPNYCVSTNSFSENRLYQSFYIASGYLSLLTMQSGYRVCESQSQLMPIIAMGTRMADCCTSKYGQHVNYLVAVLVFTQINVLVRARQTRYLARAF